MNYTRIINDVPINTYSQYFIDNNDVDGWVFAPEYTGSYILPKWNGIDYYEGATSEEIAEIQRPILLERLQNYSTDLLIRAKAAAIGKKGDKDYLLGQVEMYDNKYAFSKGVFFSQLIFDEMTKEAIEFGITIGVPMDLEAFKQLVIYMHDDASERYRVFVYMIERCRTFIQTLIETNEFTRTNQAFDLIETLSDVSQAIPLMTQILEL